MCIIQTTNICHKFKSEIFHKKHPKILLLAVELHQFSSDFTNDFPADMLKHLTWLLIKVLLY